MIIDSIWGNIFKAEKKDPGGILAILKKVPIFEELDGSDLLHIKRILHRRQYAYDEIIFRQGDPGLGMYIIESGIVSIINEPSLQPLAELSDGEFFGELSLLDDSPRTATAISKSDSSLLCFFQPDLLDILERNPRLGVKILVQLARTIGARLKKNNDTIYMLRSGRLSEDE